MSPPAACVLVCGGAGYIGSHVCKRLHREGFRVVTLDNLSTGHRDAVKWGELEVADLLDPPAVSAVFGHYRFDAVVHLAALSIVQDSVHDPAGYFRNNVVGTLNLLDAMRASGVHRLVYSSTAAVYGSPSIVPIPEDHPTRPVNPYGWSKLAAEQLIEQSSLAWPLRAMSLRYFNAAGADSEGEIGELHEPETHLIPNLLRSALSPSPQAATIYGDGYDTRDGTCIRDYIHVEDIAEAHLAALQATRGGQGADAFNIGSGQGYSVREVLAECRRQCGGRPDVVVAGPRPGDPPVLIADIVAARRILGFSPRLGLDAMVSSALRWHRGLERQPSLQQAG